MDIWNCAKTYQMCTPSFDNGPWVAVGGNPTVTTTPAHVNRPKALVPAPVIARLLLPKYLLEVWLKDWMGNTGACIGRGNKKSRAIWKRRSIWDFFPYPHYRRLQRPCHPYCFRPFSRAPYTVQHLAHRRCYVLLHTYTFWCNVTGLNTS